MKQHMTYQGGLTVESPEVQWFWRLVENMTPEQHKALLRFWSGSPIPPVHGFDPKYNLYGEKWCITRADTAHNLPTSSTWYVKLALDLDWPGAAGV